MSDYTPLGLQKIAEQAAREPRLIRCPRDGVVMRVVTSERIDSESTGDFERSGSTHPPEELEVECPACGRRASGIRPVRTAQEKRPVARR